MTHNKRFEQVWAEQEAKGFQYGPEALEHVRVGFELASASHDALAAAARILIGRIAECQVDLDPTAPGALEEAMTEVEDLIGPWPT